MSASRPDRERDDAALARAVLADLADPDPWILLHGESSLVGRGPLSDVDTTVGSVTVDELLRSLQTAPGGLQLVAVWPYDCRGVALFLASSRLDRVVQLDVLADPEGLGRYGVRTAELAARAVGTEHPWRRPDPLDQALYLLSKRTAKGQADRVSTLVDELGHHDREAVRGGPRSCSRPSPPGGWPGRWDCPPRRGRPRHEHGGAPPSWPGRCGDFAIPSGDGCI